MTPSEQVHRLSQMAPDLRLDIIQTGLAQGTIPPEAALVNREVQLRSYVDREKLNELGPQMATPPDGLQDADLAGLPGADLVFAGLRELREWEAGEYGLMLLIAAPRLTRLGLAIPARDHFARPLEHRHYSLLESTYGAAAYGRYDSLLCRMASFSQMLEQRIHRYRP